MRNEENRGGFLYVLVADIHKYIPVKSSAAGGNVPMKVALTIAVLSPPRVMDLAGSHPGGVNYLAQNK